MNGTGIPMTINISNMVPLIQVFDMPTSIAFYREALGFEVVQDSGQGSYSGWVLLGRDGVELMLNTQYEAHDRPAESNSDRQKWHGDTCLYFACSDVDEAFRHLTTQGLDINPPSVAAYGMRQLYVRDPDGYNLCFQWPV